MAVRHDDTDGSDIFWPGYVDAVTNLVLNLLFLLTIMTVAVFMFALELGRASSGGAGKPPAASSKKNATFNAKEGGGAIPAVASSQKGEISSTKEGGTDTVRENIALKREIQRLNMLLARQTAPKPPGGVVEKTVDVTSAVPASPNRIAKTIAASDTDVVVRFTDEAVSFTSAEHDRLRELLKPIVAHGKSSIHVEVPAGFSEAKRMGFYRAMAVRNLLIEMKMPKDSIDILVRDGKSNANAAIVRVKAQR